MKKFRKIFLEIYDNDEQVLTKQFQRYENLIEKYKKIFGKHELHFFSSPGRTEIGGNHTDHNHGRVLAASVNLDAIAVVAVNNENHIKMFSDGYPEPFYVDLHNLEIVKKEEGTTSALIRGIAARFKQLGFQVGGFNAYINSDVLPGSGLSSSASIEVLIGIIFNSLFNESKIPPETIAMIGQFSENHYFGKPCGLMDQMACAVGGIITIDFKEPQNPVVKNVNFDFNSQDFSLLVVDTGGTHADLTDDYASIPQEMKSVANYLNADVCRDLQLDDIFTNIKELRTKVGDRAILRFFHFAGDNARVLKQVEALESGNFNQFLQLVNDSGNSSFKWLQNIYSSKTVKEQGVSLALALSEKYLEKVQAGACRVHGGGFAGTIQVFLPNDSVEDYCELMESVFGKARILVLKIRPYGALYLNKFFER